MALRDDLQTWAEGLDIPTADNLQYVVDDNYAVRQNKLEEYLGMTVDDTDGTASVSYENSRLKDDVNTNIPDSLSALLDSEW